MNPIAIYARGVPNRASSKSLAAYWTAIIERRSDAGAVPENAIRTKRTVSIRYPAADDPIVLIQRCFLSLLLSRIRTRILAFRRSPARRIWKD